MADGTVVVTDLLVECYGCGVAKEHFGTAAVSSDEREKWDALSSLLPTKGWRVAGPSGERHAFCPNCAPRDEAIKLPPYDHKARCQMCRGNKVKTTFDPGTKPTSFVQAAHLVRTCIRCGFEWYEGPADDETKTEPVVDEQSGQRLE